MRATVERLFCRETEGLVALKPYLEVLKLRIAMVTSLSAVAGLMAGGAIPGPGLVAAVTLSVLLAAMGAGALNHALEADLDAVMTRTMDRPLPTGRLTERGHVAILGAILVVAGSLAGGLLVGPITGLFTFLGAFTYVVIYTKWLKRKTWMNVIIGGLAGSFAVLAGAAANPGGLSHASWELALVLFLWSPSHFWALAVAFRDDYKRGGVPMLPVLVGPRLAAASILISDILLAAATLLPFFTRSFGYLYLIGAVGAVLWLLIPGVRLYLNPGNREIAMAGFKGSMFHLAVLFSAIFIDRGIGGGL